MLELLLDALQSRGYQTLVAHDGPTALATEPRIAAPDVALLDISLPAMDGYELAGWLRR